MKFKYKDQIITASSKVEAIKIISNSKTTLDETAQEDIFNRARDGDKSILKLPKEDLMIKDSDWWTPIHFLAWEGVKEILKLHKELLMVKNKYGNTPVHSFAHAFELGNISVSDIEEILKLPRDILRIKNDKGETPITILSDKGIEIPEKFKDLI